MLATFLQDVRGSMAIESAFVIPFLGMLALGTVDAGMLISRQQEVQSAGAEAEGILVAIKDPATLSVSAVEDALETSLGIADPNLTLQRVYRCNSGVFRTTAGGCSTGEQNYQYIRVVISDRFTPNWTHFGIGSPIDMSVTRTVQIQ